MAESAALVHSVPRPRPGHIDLLQRWPVAALSALLGLLVFSALLSAFLEPGRQAGLVLATLAANAMVSIGLALRGRPKAIPILLSVGTITSVLLLGWVILVDPGLAGTKTPLIRGAVAQWLASLHLSAGHGIAHPNLAGVVAAMVVPGWFALALSANRLATGAAGWSLLILSIATLAISGSRGGMVAALCGTAAVVGLRYRRTIWLLPVIVALALTAVFGPWGIGDSIVRLIAVGSGNDQGRLPVWEASVRAILQSPWIGRGIGSFPTAYVRLPGGDAFANGTHNTFLQVWLDFGLLGLIALVGLTGLLLLACARAPRDDPAAQAIAGVAVAWVVISLVESTVIVSWRTGQPWQGFQEAVAPLAFILWGLAAATPWRRDPGEPAS